MKTKFEFFILMCICILIVFDCNIAIAKPDELKKEKYISTTCDHLEVIGVINVQCYGAVGDGIADDTFAIQNAIDAASGINGISHEIEGFDSIRSVNEVYLPPGAYRITSPLNIPHGLTFRGTGPDATNLLHDGTGECLKIGDENNPVRNIRITGLSIFGRTNMTSGPAIKLHWGFDCLFSDLRIKRAGIISDMSNSNRFFNVKINDPSNGVCLILRNDSNSTSIVSCRFTPGFGRKGILIEGFNSGGAIVGCIFDGAKVGIELVGLNGSVVGTHISGCHFEYQETSIKVGFSEHFVWGLSVTGNHIYASKKHAENPPHAIQLDKCKGAFFGGNSMIVEGGGEFDSSIQVTENTSYVAFVGNWSEGGTGMTTVSGGTNHNHQSYVEIMNAAASESLRRPFRMHGAQHGFFDLPFLNPDRLGYVQESDRDQYGRFQMRTDPVTGKKQLWVALGSSLILLAEED